MAVGGNNRRAKGRSNSPDTRAKRVATTEQKLFQKMYRIDCLKHRATEDRLTEKNLAEAERLGVKV